MAELREEIAERNDGRPSAARLSTSGAKAALVERLQADDAQVPPLPERPQGWHPQTIGWWRDVWCSPMAPEWDAASDRHSVALLAMLVDDLWTAESPSARAKAAGEIRLQRADLGLSPYARRRLEWVIEESAAAKARGHQRRAHDQKTAQRRRGPDPRLILADEKYLNGGGSA